LPTCAPESAHSWKRIYWPASTGILERSGSDVHHGHCQPSCCSIYNFIDLFFLAPEYELDKTLAIQLFVNKFGDGVHLLTAVEADDSCGET
jgi:hypothetical protein